jgi:iron complex outermembrane recepter protein
MTRWVKRVLVGTALLPSVAGAQAVDVSGVTSAAPPRSAASAPASAASSATDGGLDTQRVVVTAQRYKQFLQDVPLSMSAVSAEELQARNAQTLDELQYSIPGLSMYEYGVGQQFVQLRGVSTDIGSSTVGVYFDETPLTLVSQGNGLNVRLLDMQRVEVLRGPQATLYGESSMGGTIRYIPNEPKLSGGLSGSVEGKFSSVDSGGTGYDTTGVLNVPLVEDRLGLRLMLNHEDVAGWIDSAATGQKDVNGAEVNSFRGTLLGAPTDRVTVSLMDQYQRTDQGYQDYGFSGVTHAAVPTYARDEYNLVEGKVDVDLDFATLTGIASYLNRTNDTQSDYTSYLLPTLTALGAPAGSITSIGVPIANDYDVYYGELRLSSQDKGALGWTIGANYRDTKAGLAETTNTAPGASPITVLELGQRTREKTFALYGEVSYAFTPKLKLTGGLRYFHERLAENLSGSTFGSPLDNNSVAPFVTFNPHVNLSYAASGDSLYYANVAKGFRGGGFNVTSEGTGVPQSYKPDNIWTYEAGTKQQLVNNRVFLDASVYRSMWSDVQAYAFAPGSVLTYYVNGGHVEGWGTDVSLSARPINGLTLTGTWGWNNLAFNRVTGDKNVGDPVDGAARQNLSASLDYRHALTAGVTGFFLLDYQHSGHAQQTLRNFGEIVQQPGRTLVNLRLGADVKKYEVALFVSNLFDQRHPYIVGPAGVVLENVEQRPRVIGVSARADF